MELVKLANETIHLGEDFLKVIKNPNSSKEVIDAAIKAVSQASRHADKKLEGIIKKGRNQ